MTRRESPAAAHPEALGSEGEGDGFPDALDEPVTTATFGSDPAECLQRLRHQASRPAHHDR